MAGDAHPVDGAAANPSREGTEPAGRDGVTVTGNPTARELTAVLAAVRTARRRRPTTAPSSPGESAGNAASGHDGAPGTANAADDSTDRKDVERPDSRERVAHERRCPVCRERYDSTRPLEGATSVRTAKRGASTVCVDPGSKRVYVHSPPPR